MRLLFVVFTISFLLLVLGFQSAQASHLGFCQTGSIWNGAGDCQELVHYQDQGGAGLQSCQYRVVSNATETLGWTNVTEFVSPAISCSGNDLLAYTGGITIGAGLNCRDQGQDICKAYTRAIDNSNNIYENPTPFIYDIDYTAPTVSADNASSQWFSSRDVTLSVSDTGGSGLPTSPGRYSWDTNNFNAACTTGGDGSYNNNDKVFVPQGSHRLYLCARDNAGNVGNWDSGPDQYRVDKNPPTISLFTVSPTYPPNSVTTGQPTLTVSWKVADAGGSHLKEVQIWRAPYDTNTCNGTNNSGCTWGSGPEQTVPAPVNSDSWDKTGQNAYAYSPTGDGIYEYGIHVLDNAGWERTETQNGLSTKTVRIKLTNAAPTLSSVLLSPASPFPANKQFTFSGNWTDPEQSEGEQSRLFVCKNSGIPSGNNCSGGNTNNWCVSSFSTTSPSTCSYTTQASDEGTKTYYAFECDDGQGKLCSPYISGTFLVDATAPAISVFNVSPEAPNWANASNPAITISWTASDNTGGSGVKRYELWRAPDNNGSPGNWGDKPVPGKENIPPSATSTTDSPGNGVWWYGLHAVDNVGNWAPQSGLGKKVQVDTVAPPKPTCSPTGGTFQNSVLVTCSDTEGGVVIRLTENGTPPTPSSTQYTSSWTITNTETLTVAAWDSAGNRSASPDNAYAFTITHNQPPNASFNCTPSNCAVYNTETLTFNNNSTDPDGSGDITRSEWDILNWGSTPDNTCSGTCNHTLQPISPNTYTMQLTVIDSASASDTDTRSFTVKRDIVAGFMCSLDNANFVACSSLSGKISQGETLYLKDSSALAEYTVVSEGASSVTSRTWKINGTPFGGNSANPSTTIPTQGTVTLELTAQDNQGRSDTQTHTLNPQVPFPEFQEISPF